MQSLTTPNKLTTSRDTKVREVYDRMSVWILPEYGFVRTEVEDTREKWEGPQGVAVWVSLNGGIFDPVSADLYDQEGNGGLVSWNHRGLADCLEHVGLTKIRVAALEYRGRVVRVEASNTPDMSDTHIDVRLFVDDELRQTVTMHAGRRGESK